MSTDYEALVAICAELTAALARMQKDCADAGNALAEVEIENEALRAELDQYKVSNCNKL